MCSSFVLLMHLRRRGLPPTGEESIDDEMPIVECRVAAISHISYTSISHFGPAQAAEANFAPRPSIFLVSNAQPWLWGVEATEAKQSSLRPDPPDAYKT